jgi:chemotaxis protein MotB
LSVARATNTAYFLMHNEGINDDKVSIVGYAANKPIASNDTPQGRSQNRRVDIVILKKLKSHNYETKNKTIR